MRQCLGCGEMKDKRTLMRVLKTPEDEIVLDLTGKKNGRGAYICKNLDCLQKAKKSKGPGIVVGDLLSALEEDSSTPSSGKRTTSLNKSAPKRFNEVKNSLS